MNIGQLSYQMTSLLKPKAVLLLSALAVSPLGVAADMSITAKFTPDPTNPTLNKFLNTTPVSGYCRSLPAECQALGMFSLNVPLSTSPLLPISANHNDPRKGAMFKVSSEWQDVRVIEAESGESHIVKFRLNGFGATYRVSPTVQEITGAPNPIVGHQRLWRGSSWVNAPAPCRGTGMSVANSAEYLFFWRLPETGGVCSKQSLFGVDQFHMQAVNISYEMVTPNPLRMSKGSYKSVVDLTYLVGQGGDFDFGDQVVANMNSLTFDFSLEVNHILQVKFPPGAERLALIPQGGWQQWIHRGRRPEKLFANQNFKLWSSGKFAMRLECQHPGTNGNCAIENETGDVVSVSTAVTVPPGFSQSGNRTALSALNDETFEPALYVDNANATLHFEVDKTGVEQMTRHPGSQYSGNVTVIWDGDI
ncbi:MAG: hypothetical protein GAK37_01192 [Pseudomonas sp.]|nr:MAG: hypothetical protein GAK37_01192 [Pseudomonas sp.]